MYHKIFVPKNLDKSRQPFFQIIWHLISFIIWIAFYLVDSRFASSNNMSDFLYFILVIVVYALLQEILVNRLIKIYPYWAIIIISGIFLGAVFTIVFLVTLFSVALGVSIVTANILNSPGNKTQGVILSALLIPTSGAVVLILFIYILWYRIAKPIHNSDKLDERKKFIFEGIIHFAVAFYLGATLIFAFLVIFSSNMLIASFLTFIALSIGTFSSFRELYQENMMHKGFEIKQNIILPPDLDAVSKVD